MSQLQLAQQRVDGVEEVRRLLDGPDIICVPLGSSVPRGMVMRAAAGEVSLRAGYLDANIRTRVSVDSDLITFSMKLESDAALFSFRSGKDVEPGEVFRLTRGDVNDYRLNGRMRFALVSLSRDLLLHYGGEDALRRDVGFWERRQWFRAAPGIRALVNRSVETVVARVSTVDWAVAGPALQQLQFEMIEPFLWGIMFDEHKFPERHAFSSAAIVRKVEAWVDGQSPATIQIADLCRALHLSRRTLQRAFTETLGIGPARYLTLKRLTAVRAELRRSDPAFIRVTDTAIKYGFWELGRFAQDYRRMFGERPSETLSKGAI
ncbi:MAG TPA: helix-turn-helix domain-containing protein [Steroidobacteraceae bacterium]|nr:helix-turn-helix domain-containing protein [Steroidobacteraceae bacterium]